MKNKWIWIAVGLIIFAGIIFYGTSSSMCKPPCL